MQQVEAYIEILNLNHYTLRTARSDALKGLLDPMHTLSKPHKKRFLQTQFDRIDKNPKMPYRQFIRIYLATKLGFS